MNELVVLSEAELGREIQSASGELSPEKLANLFFIFRPYIDECRNWGDKIKTLVVKDENDTLTIGLATTAYKHVKSLRIGIEKARKLMKEAALREGQAVHAAAKYLMGHVAPLEEHLKAQANYTQLLHEAIQKKALEAQLAAREEARQLEELNRKLQEAEEAARVEAERKAKLQAIKAELEDARRENQIKLEELAKIKKENEVKEAELLRLRVSHAEAGPSLCHREVNRASVGPESPNSNILTRKSYSWTPAYLNLGPIKESSNAQCVK